MTYERLQFCSGAETCSSCVEHAALFNLTDASYSPKYLLTCTYNIDKHMRRPEKIRKRISQLEESAEDAPDELEEKIRAQIHILEWVLEGDFHQPDGEVVGHLEYDPDIFDEIVLAGLMGSKTFVGERSDKPGRYVLLRREDV